MAVTGAAGFLGAALVRRLVAEGTAVLALVRADGSRERLAGFGDQVRVRPLDMDALATKGGDRLVGEELAAFSADAVVHAAWSGVRGDARNDPRQVRNVCATLALLEACAASGVRRFVGLGSQAEYGPSVGATREDAPTRPTTVYGAAKLAAGHLVVAAAPRLGVSAAWARVFSVYGPGDAPGTLLRDLTDALRSGRTLPLSSGEQRWDYLHVDDAASALALLSTAEDATGFYNLGSGSTVRIRDVATNLAALVAPGVTLAFGTAGGDGITHLEADVGRLRRDTGWGPRVSIEEGLASIARPAAAPTPS